MILIPVIEPLLMTVETKLIRGGGGTLSSLIIVIMVVLIDPRLAVGMEGVPRDTEKVSGVSTRESLMIATEIVEEIWPSAKVTVPDALKVLACCCCA